MRNKSTDELLNVLNGIKDSSDLNKFIMDNEVNLNLLSFVQYMDSIIIGKNLTKSEIISDSNIDRTYAYQILNGTRKPSRDKIIKLCISCKMNLTEVQKALTLSRNGKLYTKIKRDAIIIFAINKGLNVIDSNILLQEMNEPFLD